MPRKPRLEYAGAFYHVIVRGNQRQRIFRDQADFSKYLLLLTVYKNRTSCRIYGYVLMSNHVHLLIESQDVPLSKIMQGLNQTYTMYFNRRYRTVGHLFQGRYKAILCDRDAYLLSLVKYIHKNPVRAKIAQSPDLYPWSSHRAYIGRENPQGVVDTDQVLRIFSENKTRARSKYREFMQEEETLTRTAVYATIDQRLQGDDDFVDSVQERVDQQVLRGKKKKEYNLSEIGAAVAAASGVDARAMRAATRQSTVSAARRLLSIVATTYGYKRIEIANYLKKDPAAVSLYLKDERVATNVAAAVVRELEKGKRA